MVKKNTMDSIETDKCWLLVDESATRDQAFEKCAWLAWKGGFKLFGVDSNNNCSSGFVATKFYRIEYALMWVQIPVTRYEHFSRNEKVNIKI